jgi:high-affinity nickel-transport protein
MTLLDSADSVLMLYSYTGFPERSFFVFEKRENTASDVVRKESRPGWEDPEKAITGEDNKQDKAEQPSTLDSERVQGEGVREAIGEGLKPAEIKIGDPEKLREGEEEKLAVNVDKGIERNRRAKLNVMSGLSITLTLMSILVAFR